MAEENDSNAIDHRGEAAPARRSRSRSNVARPSTSVASSRPAKTKRPRSIARPLKSLAVVSMVGGLIATVAIPAFVPALTSNAEAQTLQQVAADDAQSLIVASDAVGTTLARDSYSATTQAEIDEKKAKEAAAAAALERAAAVASTSSASIPVNMSLVSPGSGEVRWPLLNFTSGRGLWDSGYHQGWDMLASCGEPVYAAAAGVVRVSQESYGGYGVAITIDHVVGGQPVNTLYGHMTYGSRMAEAGQYVAAGQMIGLVGTTGSSTACHTHFEVYVNDTVVEPSAWLQANAG